MIKNPIKTRRCPECKNEFTPVRPLQKTCSLGCAVKAGKPIAKKSADKKWKAEKKVLKENTMTYTKRVNKVKEIFQEYIRLRDKGNNCISCNSPTSYPWWTAGHYKKAELYRGVIFDLDNAWLQCVKCNMHMDGNEANYRTSLVAKIGEQRVKELEIRAEETKRYKYTPEELHEIKTKYKALCKSLER